MPHVLISLDHGTAIGPFPSKIAAERYKNVLHLDKYVLVAMIRPQNGKPRE